MTGIFLIAVFIGWFVVSFLLAVQVARRCKNFFVKLIVGLMALAALLALPVADEIVGGYQFSALCRENASEFKLGVANPEGRTTRVTINPSNEYLDGKAIPIRHSHIEYHDINTGELVVALDSYVAKGGVLIRALGISNSNSPLTIGLPACSPTRGQNARLIFKFNVVN